MGSDAQFASVEEIDGEAAAWWSIARLGERADAAAPTVAAAKVAEVRRADRFAERVARLSAMRAGAIPWDADGAMAVLRARIVVQHRGAKLDRKGLSELAALGVPDDEYEAACEAARERMTARDAAKADRKRIAKLAARAEEASSDA